MSPTISFVQPTVQIFKDNLTLKKTDPDVSSDFSGNQKLLCSPVMFLLQLAAVSQLGSFIRALQLTCSGGCLFSGSGRLQSALCVFCWVECFVDFVSLDSLPLNCYISCF